MSKNKPQTKPQIPTPAPAPAPAPAPTPVPVPEPTPAPALTPKQDLLASYLKQQYELLAKELCEFKLLINWSTPTIKEKVENLESLRRCLKTISGLTVTLVTSHGTDWTPDDLKTAVEFLKSSNYKLPRDMQSPSFSNAEDWPSWNKMIEEFNGGFNPQAVRRLLVMNGLRFEASQKIERAKKEGNPWGNTLKSFKAWVITTDTPSLSIWDRLVPSVDKIPQDQEGLDKLKRAYASLKDLGF